MASAIVGSPSPSCQSATGSWLVTIVERTPAGDGGEVENLALELHPGEWRDGGPHPRHHADIGWRLYRPCAIVIA
jgi:hypothetical protein